MLNGCLFGAGTMHSFSFDHLAEKIMLYRITSMETDVAIVTGMT
jgi:hypothetical protein